MATENIGQPEGETSAHPLDEAKSVAGSPEIAPAEHEHEHHKRAWYATLNEDWLATIAGLILVVLLVVRVLHAIP